MKSTEIKKTINKRVENTRFSMDNNQQNNTLSNIEYKFKSSLTKQRGMYDNSSRSIIW